MPAPDEPTRRAWRQAIHAAKSRGLVPEGHHLRHTGRNKGDLIVRLVPGDHPAARYRGKHPIPISDDLIHHHAAVAAVGEDDAVRGMSRSVRRRVLAVLQAIAAEAERRGYEVCCPGGGGAQLRLLDGDLGCTVTVTELTESRPRKLTAEEIQARKLYPWQRIPQEYVQTPTGQLEIEADCGFSGKLRRHDGQRWRIEDKLWDVFATFERAAEVRARQRAEQDRRAAAEERKRAEQREHWEHAMAEARMLALEDQRVRALSDQLAGWQRARTVRAYADAIEDHLRRAAAAESAEATAEWIAWIRAYADRIDPVPQLPHHPDESAISADDLRSYLGGLSPDGPDYQRSGEVSLSLVA